MQRTLIDGMHVFLIVILTLLINVTWMLRNWPYDFPLYRNSYQRHILYCNSHQKIEHCNNCYGRTRFCKLWVKMTLIGLPWCFSSLPNPFHFKFVLILQMLIWRTASFINLLSICADVDPKRCSFCRRFQWVSSTGLTAVSKFKPRLPAQWAVGTHRNGPSRMEKVTSGRNRPIRNSTQIRNWI